MTPNLRAAFQGERGAYSEEAAVKFFGEDVTPVPCPTFDEVFEQVDNRKSDYGVAPIENSLGGSIHRNYDLLLRNDLHIVGETAVRVRHALIVHRGVKLEQVRRVYSHPQALAQCEKSLDRWPQLERVSTYDTAGSVKLLKEQNIMDGAAIASRRAAEIYGMDILEEGLEDSEENYTRFLILSREPVQTQGPSKTSIVFSMANVPGALFKTLAVFALRDIDLFKIESRPLQGKAWDYFFYVDFAGGLHEERCQNALNNLKEITTYLKILGSYPRSV
jgi:arogenate/prephenate dehydratase